MQMLILMPLDMNLIVYLTKLVEVCVNAMRSWYRAEQSGFYEGAPLINQNSLSSNIILAENTEKQFIKHSCVYFSKMTLFIVLSLCSSTMDLVING